MARTKEFRGPSIIFQPELEDGAEDKDFDVDKVDFNTLTQEDLPRNPSLRRIMVVKRWEWLRKQREEEKKKVGGEVWIEA